MAIHRVGNSPTQQQQQGRAAKPKQLATKEREHLETEHLDSETERQIAVRRKHAMDLDDEALKHSHIDRDTSQKTREEEEAKKVRLKGIDWDERRKKRGQRDPDDGEQEDTAEEQAAKAMGLTEDRGRYFEAAPEDRMGDDNLVDPNEIRRFLGPSSRFAEHCMMLTHQKMLDGMPRHEAIEDLSQYFLGLKDRGYAQRALKEFGPATGILDIYPLEVLQHVLSTSPHTFPSAKLGRFLTETPKTGYKGTTGKPIHLAYDHQLRIRGFAVKGGGKPGYLFEPGEEPGSYELTFFTPGKFTLLMSATLRQRLLIEELELDIKQGDEDKNREAIEALTTKHAAPDGEPKKKKKKKQDLRVTIPRRI